MEFDAERLTRGIQLGIGVRIVLNHDVAWILLGAAVERDLALARQLKRRRIPAQQLNRLAIGSLKDQASLLAYAIEALQYSGGLRVAFVHAAPVHCFRKRSALGV